MEQKERQNHQLATENLAIRKDLLKLSASVSQVDDEAPPSKQIVAFHLMGEDGKQGKTLKPEALGKTFLDTQDVAVSLTPSGKVMQDCSEISRRSDMLCSAFEPVSATFASISGPTTQAKR
eukprot:gnl/MRDRNA2_/MRDRNA2_72007_c0_seq2.p1 gnl/MRDRNA2_/MRDRNA2_72007_c0~~gnl/MRDRNA2_/MRDRNA2_72007_c0_seq2.p1  ORF type:complete len:132 (-),score=27.77 gnl/MRDRNA2_/MRDRNA2_72007_c0_seq2:107-469(-)